MDFGIAQVLLIGGAAVLGGLTYLVLLVGCDLAPASGLFGPRRWLLLGGLGVGVFAFSAKLLAIAILAHWRPAHPDLSRASPVVTASPAFAVEAAPQRLPPLWHALPEVAPAPADNPTTPERIALGRRLFFEARLSRDGTLSCASCHDLTRGGADRAALSTGVGGQLGARNTPTV